MRLITRMRAMEQLCRYLTDECGEETIPAHIWMMGICLYEVGDDQMVAIDQGGGEPLIWYPDTGWEKLKALKEGDFK